jgi:hypothetical protein
MALLAIDHSAEHHSEAPATAPTLIILSDVEHDQPTAEVVEFPAPAERRSSLFDRPKQQATTEPRMRPSQLRRRADGAIDAAAVARAARPSALRRSNLSGLGAIH